MNNNYSIAERNKIVEEHLWCVKAVMKQNRTLIEATRLDRDDVFQQLAERLIRTVIFYDPEKSPLVDHLWASLRYELSGMVKPEKLTGVKNAPKDFHIKDMVSFENMEAGGHLFAEQEAA